jgi:erythromycin esterase
MLKKILWCTFFCIYPLWSIAQAVTYKLNNQDPGILCLVDSNMVSSDCYKSIADFVNGKSIIGIGEGTHGTKEFNLFRSTLSKVLIENRDFNYICFENSYGGAVKTDLAIKNGAKDIIGLLNANFLGIYQTREILEFFRWFSSYPKSNVIKIVGMDYAEITPALDILETNLIEPLKYRADLEKLRELCLYSDKSFTRGFDRDLWLKNGMIGYDIISKIRSDSSIKKKDALQFAMASLNVKFGFEVVYRYKTTGKELSRDSAMSEMVATIKHFDPKAKILLWAHAAHVSKQPIYPDLNGGGEGRFLNDKFPGQYFAIGTLTSKGTYSVTKDAFPTKVNYFFKDRLIKPPKDAIETKLESYKYGSLVFDPTSLGTQKFKMRFSGFQRQKQGDSPFVLIQPSNCFDLLVYFKLTNSPDHF